MIRPILEYVSPGWHPEITCLVGRRGSAVARATCTREIEGSIAGWTEFAVGAVPLGKVLTQKHTLSTQE